MLISKSFMCCREVELYCDTMFWKGERCCCCFFLFFCFFLSLHTFFVSSAFSLFAQESPVTHSKATHFKKVAKLQNKRRGIREISNETSIISLCYFIKVNFQLHVVSLCNVINCPDGSQISADLHFERPESNLSRVDFQSEWKRHR